MPVPSEVPMHGLFDEAIQAAGAKTVLYLT
jgi:hypothetical protein